MKKTILVILLALFILPSLFAETGKNNYIVQGIAASSDHVLALYYGDTDISDSTGFDLSNVNWKIDDSTVENSTDIFTISTVSGNASMESTLEVTIEPSVFTTTFSNQTTFQTDITPEVIPTSDMIGNFSNDNKTITNIIPSGDISEKIILAKFKLLWVGNESIPAGEYKSTITISYKLE